MNAAKTAQTLLIVKRSEVKANDILYKNSSIISTGFRGSELCEKRREEKKNKQ